MLFIFLFPFKEENRLQNILLSTRQARSVKCWSTNCEHQLEMAVRGYNHIPTAGCNVMTVNNKFRRYESKWPWPTLWCNHSIFPVRIRKPIRITRFSAQFRAGTPECDVGELISTLLPSSTANLGRQPLVSSTVFEVFSMFVEFIGWAYSFLSNQKKVARFYGTLSFISNSDVETRTVLILYSHLRLVSESVSSIKDIVKNGVCISTSPVHISITVHWINHFNNAVKWQIMKSAITQFSPNLCCFISDPNILSICFNETVTVADISTDTTWSGCTNWSWA
jgi:hypothetical protein